MVMSSTIFHCCVVTVVILMSTLFTTSLAQDSCIEVDSPNPVAAEYPLLVSGNLNGTTLIVPIPLSEARILIPKQYAILENAYREILPSFGQGMYPMMVSFKRDHDIQLPAYNASLPDFARASFEFPFLDITGDGYTSYRLQNTAMITSTNEGAISGAAGLGLNIYPAEFSPSCNAYAPRPGGGWSASADTGGSNDTLRRFMHIDTLPCPETVPYPFEFIKNITNQVTFANTTYCDHYQLLYNTSLTAAPNEPIPVFGDINAKLEPFTEARQFSGVYGWQYAAAFLEPPLPEACPPTASV
ncbi:hypothetical protein BX600DRAFT_436934 [Xylariales sp. PMI_506]|nr:hypothetical protein BX600DRAFT_436934 [Xylariales sp. PMI_506]